MPTETFTYTGSQQSWTVPEDIYEVDISVWGADGGDADPDVNSSGGGGGSAKGTLSVSPGDTLYIYVGGEGGQGEHDYTGSTASGGAGGWNGGGDGGNAGTDSGSDAHSGGGGGGGTDVRYGGNNQSDRIIIGGGGGGAGGETFNGGGGGGGTGTASGTLFQGQDGDSHYASGIDAEAAGAGGGGHYGGEGGGANGKKSEGGGGGTTHIDSSLTDTTFSPSGSNSGNGKVIIEYRTTPYTPTNFSDVVDVPNVEVDLSWDNQNNDPVTEGYNIYRGTSSGFATDSNHQIATINGANNTTYTDTGVTRGTTYYYVVTARSDTYSTESSDSTELDSPVAVRVRVYENGQWVKEKLKIWDDGNSQWIYPSSLKVWNGNTDTWETYNDTD